MIVAAVFFPILIGFSFWIIQVGSVEALPIFPAFIAVFYGWVLLQAYFIAAPVSHGLEKIEQRLSPHGKTTKVIQVLGTATLLLPVIPLAYGVWLISSWIGAAYQNVPEATSKILLWTISVLSLLLLTFFLVATWGWSALRRGRPQSTVFAGAIFAVLWVYLLYRSSALLTAYLNQSQPSNALVDIGLMGVSILGAMQTFATKTINRAVKRWSQVFPFLVFSFGSIYAVAQLYFIVEFAITRAELSVFVNATVLASGLLTMMLIIRRHLSGLLPLPQTPVTVTANPSTPPSFDSIRATKRSPLSWVKTHLSAHGADGERSDDDE